MAGELARAKVNLALHVTGQRSDGYHLLDSLVAFPSVADRVTLIRGGTDGLNITGRFSDSLTSDSGNNLILAARRALEQMVGRQFGPLHFELEKNLPIASGIGGGSADAAAALRQMNAQLELGLSESELAVIGLQLGADIPVCIGSRVALMRGIGEELETVPQLPDCSMILINPGVSVSTIPVFKALAQKDNPPLPPLPDRWGTLDTLVAWLHQTRNDLEPAAITVCPEIADVLASLDSVPAVKLARMSGSGATCFGICEKGLETEALETLKAAHPDWWVAAGSLN